MAEGRVTGVDPSAGITKAPGPVLATSVLETATGEVTLTTLTRGEIGADAVSYARRRLGQLLKRMEAPLLFARVKLSIAADPATARPAMAQASVGVNGRIVRAQVAAHEMHEAIDLLQRRLASKLRRTAQRSETLRRRAGRSEPGEWRHGDLPTDRPDHFDRPVEERQLVRHKAFAATEQTIDEAAFDMEQLDYDFHMFRDVESGQDSLLERLPDGGYRLQHLWMATLPVSPLSTDVLIDDRPTPVLTIQEALERLALGTERYVFFASAATGRGSVAYRRYDSHYGLITLA
jgi:ribosome-associated translation inhibitor RaiA